MFRNPRAHRDLYVLAFVCTLLWLPFDAVLGQTPELIAYLDKGKIVSGMPVVWNASQAVILESDGNLVYLDADTIQKHEVTDRPFRAASRQQLESRLQSEFGGRFSVSSRGVYTVVAKKGKSRKWAQRFVRMYTQVEKYFSVRGWNLQPSSFQLVAVVFPTREAFMAHARKHEIKISPQTLGCYVPRTNRVLLFETDFDDGQWSATNQTIMHETVHQISFNRGLHNRLNTTPLWLAEGLASVFEAPAFGGAGAGQDADMNTRRLQTWRKLIKNRAAVKRYFESMLESDRLFQQQPDAAYAISWAVTYYLSQHESDKLFRYLRHLSQLPQGTQETAPQRLEAFHDKITSEIDLLINRVERRLKK